jgi:hypothetical protein
MKSGSSSLPVAADSSWRDDEVRLSDVRETARDDGSVEMQYRYLVEPRNPSFTFEHDTRKRLFVLALSDGMAEHFRDKPARHLVVEPDPESGEMRPAIKRGQPVYVHLCREDREHH